MKNANWERNDVSKGRREEPDSPPAGHGCTPFCQNGGTFSEMGKGNFVSHLATHLDV